MIRTRSYPRSAGLITLAALLLGTGESLADPFLAVPSAGEPGSIEIVDVRTDASLRTIRGFADAHGLGITPDGQFAIVASLAERDASVGVAKPAGVSAGDHAAHHGETEAHRAAVSPSTLSVVDLAIGETVRRVDVPGGVHHIAIAPNGWHAALTHPNTGTVSILNLEDFSLAASIGVGENPNYAVFMPNGSELFISVAGENRIAVVDTSSWRIRSTIATGASPEHMVVTRDGSRLLVNLVGDEAVVVLDPRINEAIATHSLGGTLHGIDITDDDDAAIVSVTGSDKLARIGMSDGSILLVDLAPSPYHVTSVPGSGKVYVSSVAEPGATVLDQRDLSVIGRIETSGIGHQMVPFSAEPKEKGVTR